jgi:hypothetical protein
MKILIEKFSDRRLIALLGILLLANLLLFSLPNFPGSRLTILANAPNQKIPDMMGIYSQQAVYDFLTAIGPSGREAYQLMHFSTDLAFPLVYGLFLFAWLCKSVQGRAAKMQYLPLIAFIPSGADLVENFSMVYLTATFPDIHPGLVQFAQVFTLVKFAGIGIGIIVGIVLNIRNYLQKQQV